MLRLLSKATRTHYLGLTLLLLPLSCYLAMSGGGCPKAMQDMSWSGIPYAMLKVLGILTTTWLGHRIANQLGDKNGENIYFPAVFMLSLLAFPLSITSWRVVGATALLNMALLDLLSRSSSPMRRLFSAGLLLGCAALLAVPFAVFVILIYAAVSLFFGPYWKYWITVLIGLAIPPLYLCSCIYLLSLPRINAVIWHFGRGTLLDLWQNFTPIIFLSLLLYTFLGYIKKPAVLGSFQKRKFTLISIYWVLALGVLLFFQLQRQLVFVLLTPSALLITSGFEHFFNKREGEIIFWLFFSAALCSFSLS